MKDLAALEEMAGSIMRLSKATQGRETDWRGQHASLAFAKTGVTALTLLRIVPGSPHFGPVGKNFVWDLAAIAALCRCLMESYYVLCYLRFWPTDPHERQFRQWLWEYHEQFERSKMMRASIPDAKSLPQVHLELEGRRVRLESSPVFKGLSAQEQEKLIKGEKFKRISSIELSRKAGISENFYGSQYKYCSTFAHCAPVSISQLDGFRAATPGAMEILNMPVSLATAYAALAVRDFLTLFPDVAGELQPSSLQLISLWEEIVKWERSSGFSSAAETVANDPE